MIAGAAMFELPLSVGALQQTAYRAEVTTLGVAVVQRIRDGSLPPNDAAAWARVLVSAARKVDPTLGRPA